VFEKNFMENYEVKDQNIEKIDQSKELVEVEEKVMNKVFCLTYKSESIEKHYYLSLRK
jgi:fructose-1,6-bisphosphatase